MDQLGSYALRRKVCDSPLGELYDGIDRSAGRAVLVEVLRGDLLQAQSALDGWLADGRRLRELRVDGLVAVSELLDSDGRGGLVSACPAGRPVRDVLATVGRLPWEPAGQLVVEVAGVLGRLHAMTPPLAHLDVRPDRIWVAADGAVVVLCAAGGRMLADGTVAAARSVDLLRYATPELLEGSKVGPAADVYSLGLLLYELLAGHPPFQSSSARTAINMQCSETPPQLPDHVRAAAPRALWALLDELLAKQPAARPDAVTVASRLEQLLPERAKGQLAALGVPGAGLALQGVVGDGARSGKGDGARSGEGEGARDAGEPPRSPARSAGAGVDRQLSLVQIAGLVVAVTLVAATLAYCAVSDSSSPTRDGDDGPSSRPLLLEPQQRPSLPPPATTTATTSGPLGDPAW